MPATPSRRLFLGAGLAALAGCTAAPRVTSSAPPATASSATAGASASTGWLMPDEARPHTRTWMAFGASGKIWGADLVDVVRRNLADVANAIAGFEPVTMLVRPGEVALARRMLDSAVTLLPMALDDLWIRDTGPVFTLGDGRLGGAEFNFNGWGNKQTHKADALVADGVVRAADATALTTDLILEGGALEVDGEGTAIITESCVLNDNRNPDWSRAEIEDELSRLLGVQKVIWLPGIAGKDITDGHTDFYARFVAPGHVVAALDDDPSSFDHPVTRAHAAILAEATDAAGRPLTVTTLKPPTELRARDAGADFAAGYVNFYVCNGAVIAPQFGDRAADAAARGVLAEAFPGREIVQLDIDGIAAGGGGIHCSTQQQPAL